MVSVSPLAVAPHQMLAFFFRITFPITAAVGAIQYSSSEGSVGAKAPKA
jgi:hypothetical protein